MTTSRYSFPTDQSDHGVLGKKHTHTPHARNSPRLRTSYSFIVNED